jgi:molybdate transport system substrate-binding protein
VFKRRENMKKNLIAILALLTLVITTVFYGCSSAPAATPTPAAAAKPAATVELNISAAASLTDAMNKIAQSYKKTAPNVKLTFNFGASGTLQTQIEQGAATDVFISAATKQMEALVTKGLVATETKMNLLVNKVVLIVPAASNKGISDFKDCLTSKVAVIAIGDPASVPVGQYAKEIFTHLNGWDAVSKKANLGTDVKQVLSWVESGNADCGVVYATDAALSSKVKTVAEAPSGSTTPVIYPAAVLKASTKKDTASAFLKYLQSEEAGKIFSSYGFSLSK